jgi:hypothetical protein
VCVNNPSKKLRNEIKSETKGKHGKDIYKHLETLVSICYIRYVNNKRQYMRNRINIIAARLDELELLNYSEEQIARAVGCTRMGLFNYRKRIGHPQTARQGKGTSKYTADEKRILANYHQRNYNKRLIAKEGRTTRGRNKPEQNRIILQVLGRPLKKGECLHHIDNNPANNAHNNLVICTRTYHRTVFHTQQAEAKMNITH